jgi:hypothetical protein
VYYLAKKEKWNVDAIVERSKRHKGEKWKGRRWREGDNAEKKLQPQAATTVPNGLSVIRSQLE